jgi:hypothetical protein
MRLPESPLLTTRALNRALLARQMLLRRAKTDVVSAVEQLVAMQAQLARPPFVGLWTRVESFTREALIDALSKRRVVRGTSLRGTIHLMSARDFAALRGAIQPALTRGLQSIVGSRLQSIDLAAVTAEAVRFFGKAAATFDALRAHLSGAFPKADTRAIAYAARMLVPLVQVPTDARWGFPGAADFTTADLWLKKKVSTAPAPPDALVRRYLAAFGPATPTDAQIWSGLKSLRATFESLRPSLATFRDERGRELFDLPDAPRPAEETPAPVRFLPEFDNLMLAHADRTRVIADVHRARLTSDNLQVAATLLVDGLVAGVWTIERTAKSAVLVVEPFGALSRSQRGDVEAEGDRLLAFVEPDAAARRTTIGAIAGRRAART